MAKVRVSTLAKEFGMTSKELMGHLAEMKIPAKSASSALEDAYVAMVRKQLASVIEARAKEVEAAKQAEEEAAAFIKANMSKPVACYIAGVTAPAGKKMGHAGAIVSGGKGTAAAKMEALRDAGALVGNNPTEAGEIMTTIVAGL